VNGARESTLGPITNKHDIQRAGPFTKSYKVAHEKTSAIYLRKSGEEAIERFKNVEGHLHPNSPAGRALKLLQRCGLESKVFASFSEDDGLIRLDDMETDDHEMSVTSHATFGEFIEAEL